MRDLHLQLVALCPLSAAVVLASPRIAVLPSGDCQNLDLMANSRRLAEALRQRPSLELLDSTGFFTSLIPDAARKPDEIAGAIERAQTLFYQAEYSTAEKSMVDVAAEIRRLPPSAERQRLYINAQLLLGLILRAEGRVKDADESFRNVLRREPDYRLNADYFSPTVRAHFEDLRAELLAAPKVSLTVESNPAGAEVLADGYRLGITPLKRELLAAEYQLVLQKGGTASLPRRVEIQSDTSVWVDLEFESSLAPIAGIFCLSDHGEKKLRFEGAKKFAGLAGVAQVVVVWLEGEAPSRLTLAAALIDRASSREVRSGGVPIPAGTETAEVISQLATYLDTGARGEQWVAVESLSASPGSPKGSLGSNPEAVSSFASWKTPVGIALGIGGLVAGGVATTFAIQSDKSWGQYNAYYARPGGPLPEEAGSVAALRDRAESQRTTAIIAAAIGAASIGTGLYFLLSDRHAPEKSRSVAVSFQLWPLGVTLAAAF